MNGTKKNNQEQLISLNCPEEKIAALITDAKTSFENIFAALKSELVHYLHLKAATIEQLKELQERPLEGIEPFAIFLDGYHIGSVVFIVGLLVDIEGKKHVLGFWEGATENHEICIELFNNLEDRGLKLTRDIVFVIDGGKGVIKALKSRFGKDLVYQRCTVHKDRNIQSHLPKRYRVEAHRRYRNAIDCATYEDAQAELKSLEKWLERINPSAARSLMECSEELLTVHQLCVPPLLRKTLHSTNPIESMFSQVSQRMGRIKSMKKGKMAQRWVATALLEAEKSFRTVKGYLQIQEVKDRIKLLQREQKDEVI